MTFFRCRSHSFVLVSLFLTAGTNQLMMDEQEMAKPFGAIDGQLTLQKSLPMSRLAPGEYQLTVKVTD